MKTILTIFCLVSFSIVSAAQSKNHPTKTRSMKVNAGIITSKLAESKEFYTEVLQFGVLFENEFYLLLSDPEGNPVISFLLPEHPSQQALFQKAFQGRGMYLTIEVADVDTFYKEIQQKKVPIKIELRDEPWGDRHFAIEDPNGIGIDIVHYTEPGA
ncbi:VOC family protein [Chitinophaga caeni]|nr:VOC family protein [Chitinophaga caeni]